MTRRGRMGEGVCSNPACGVVFPRALRDLRRHKRQFCSHACQGAVLAGKTMIQCTCAGCGLVFPRRAAAARRARRHYCSRECAVAHVDYAAQARAGWRKTPVRRDPPALVKFERSRKAGFARAHALSPRRLREIAMLGVAARRAKASVPKVRQVSRQPSTLARSWAGPVLSRR
jgi:hypothetical protein